VLGEPITLPWLDEPRFRCFGCSPHNLVGLALKLYRLPDGRIAARSNLSELYASYPGIVHGGIVSAIVDEVMGDLVAIDHGRLAFCVTLRTRMLAPVRTARPYLTAARLVERTADVFRVEADVLDPAGEVCVMASGSYQPVSTAAARDLMGLDDAEYARLQEYFDHRIGTP
jgi:acyl-coenzyme A thioesterase PaaI-like protein